MTKPFHAVAAQGATARHLGARAPNRSQQPARPPPQDLTPHPAVPVSRQPLLSVNSEARRAALKFYDVKLPVRPVLSRDSSTVRKKRAKYLDHWRKHPVPLSMAYWGDFGRRIEELIDESFKHHRQTGRVPRTHIVGTVYLSSRHDRFVESCDVWIDMGTICPGGRRTDDYRCLDICKAHIMQDSSPDFTALSPPFFIRCYPELRPPRTHLSDPISPWVRDRFRKEVLVLARPALGAKLLPGIRDVTRRSSILYKPCQQGLVGFLQAGLPQAEGITELFQALVLNGRGDYTILTWETDQECADEPS
ncbi:hypothetical protein PG984_010265 [Apiospora sp. TS-2023a]